MVVQDNERNNLWPCTWDKSTLTLRGVKVKMGIKPMGDN